ncbi:hypothetical protein N9901_01370 [Flavobacteriaceae bacterium]|nr:hypothetical protein [Flavobacteriaceae bacterium]
MKKGLILGAILLANLGFSQSAPTTTGVQDPQTQENAINRILSGNVSGGVTVGGYGEVTYGEPEGSSLGEIDVQRLVLLFGYNFNEDTQFVTEIEFEHVNEVFVEQAFIQHRLADNFNLRAGLMLVPMGIINEYHEPTTFNGVFRPSIDKSIIPTTWREVGVGATGNFTDISLRYQAYIFNGFISNTAAGSKFLGGANSLRNGRQKGAKSVANSMNFSTKLDYYGTKGLRLGLSAYHGETSPEDETEAVKVGSTVDLTMAAFDYRYKLNNFTTRGQYIFTDINGSSDYNALTSSDLGSQMQGFYLEAAYNLLPAENIKKLDAFVRYENYNTHHNVDGIAVNDSYHRKEWTTGLSYHVAPGAVFKADYQIKGNEEVGNENSGKLNLGIGVWF